MSMFLNFQGFIIRHMTTGQHRQQRTQADPGRAQITYLVQLDPVSYTHLDVYKRQDQSYAIPYVWGITGIAYNKKYVKEPITCWADLWKPEYKGHIILLNDNREVFSLALKKLGKSNNSKNPAEVEAAFKDLKLLNTNVLAYDTENNKQKMIAEEAWIAQMWSGDAAFCNKENGNIQFVVPKEGSLIWADNMAIPKGAKNKELAEKFINFIYDPAVSARNFDYIRLPNANGKAIPLMKKEIAESPILIQAKAQSCLLYTSSCCCQRLN